MMCFNAKCIIVIYCAWIINCENEWIWAGGGDVLSFGNKREGWLFVFY